MEELATKLLAEGIQKKVVSPGKGDLSTFPDGTKVSYKIVNLIPRSKGSFECVVLAKRISIIS